MRHGPDAYTQALADLDRLLTDEHQHLVARYIDLEGRYSQLRAVGHSLANAVHNAIRHGDIADGSTQPCKNALRQWTEHTETT